MVKRKKRGPLNLIVNVSENEIEQKRSIKPKLNSEIHLRSSLEVKTRSYKRDASILNLVGKEAEILQKRSIKAKTRWE